MLRIFKNKWFISTVCILLAAIFAFMVLPQLYQRQSSTASIVELKKNVNYGTVITDDMLTTTEVGTYGLSNNVVRDKSEIIGHVAGSALYAGEYLWKERFISTEDYQEIEKKTSHGLSDGTFLITIGLPTASSGAAGVLRAGDCVDVYGYTETADKTLDVESRLTAVNVYKVYNSKLLSLDDVDTQLKNNTDADMNNYDLAPAYVVFIVNEEQAKTLIELEKNKSLHLTLRKAGA